MKRQLTSLFISLCALSLVTAPTFAADIDADQKILVLEKQLTQLQQEVSALKTQKVSSKTTKHKHTSKKTVEKTVIHGPEMLPTEGAKFLPVDMDVPGQSFVSSGPYIGVPLEYSGANLIINTPSVNQDVTLLKLRRNIRHRLAELGRPEESDHSHILLSGMVEGQALYKNLSSSNPQSDIDLTSVNLDAYVLGPSHWTSGLIELSYDNDLGSNSGSFSSTDRNWNSRVFINKAFIVIGDFSQSPIYSTLGQMYVPFGVYSSSLVSSPLTKLLARTKARALVLGFDQQEADAFYGAAYIFRGASHASTRSGINNGGLNLGYRFKTGLFDVSFNGGVIANIADSQGMQDTGNQPAFDGFGGPSVTTTSGSSVVIVNTGNEQLVHRVPAYDARAKVSIGQSIDLLGEYITASTHFSSNDLSMNSHGARPQALSAEAIYTFPWIVKPTSVTLGYGMSKDALAIGLPAQRYSVALNTSLWQDTLQSLEFRRDINYPASATSSGSGIAGPSGTGTSNNMITAQFDLYF
jgi:hypothetical protein